MAPGSALADASGASFEALAVAVLHVIAPTLPVDARARAACVCRAWRDFLADPALWQVLDLTRAGGVAAGRVTDGGLLRGAFNRAAGRVRVLRLEHTLTVELNELLIELILSDGAQLQQLSGGVTLGVDHLAEVLAAAPRLQVFDAHVGGDCRELLPLLRNDAPFGPVRVAELEIGLRDVAEGDVSALAAAVAAHEPLKGLRLGDADFRSGLGALLLDAASERRVTKLFIDDECLLDADSVPALARLLQRGSLTRLEITCQFPRVQEARMLELCAGLCACRALTHLRLRLNRLLGGENRCPVTVLIGEALLALPALAVLDLSWSLLDDPYAAGLSLGALLAVDPPSLRTLNLDVCSLGPGMIPLLRGLEQNTHLRELSWLGNNLPTSFKRERMAPAMAALAARAAAG